MLTVNSRSYRHVRRAMALGLLWVAIVAPPREARAQFTGTISGTGGFESNSNVYALQSGAPLPASSDNRRADTDYSYGAQFISNYTWGREQLYASGSTTDFEYQHLTDLNHNDYRIDAGLNWKLGDSLDGLVDVSRSHAMVPTYDLTGSSEALSLLTTQSETAQIGIKVTSEWKLQGSVNSNKSEQPLTGMPNLELTQTSGNGSINYVGFAGLSTGLQLGYLTGEYAGLNGAMNTSYSQTSELLTAQYAHTYTGDLHTTDAHNITTVGAQLGFSRRSSSGGTNSTSGVTGLLDFKQQLTPKTSVFVNVSRVINSYFLNASSEIDTSAGGGVNWQATYKLSLALAYTFTYRDYPGQGNDPVGSTRIDRQQYASLAANYTPQRWLAIKTYANLQTRRSNFIGGDFTQDIFGVSVTVTPPINIMGLNR